MNLGDSRLRPIETIAVLVAITTIIVVWSFVAYWNGNRAQDLRRERIHACSVRPDVHACMKATS